MITKQKAREEINKMRSWPMTAENVMTMAHLMIICDHLGEYEDDHDEVKHHKHDEKDIEKMFRKFMEQYYEK